VGSNMRTPGRDGSITFKFYRSLHLIDISDRYSVTEIDMSSEKVPIMEYTFPVTGRKLIVNDIAELRTLEGQELSNWHWLRNFKSTEYYSQGTSEDRNAIGQIYNIITSNFNRLRTTITELENAQPDRKEGYKGNVLNSLNAIFLDIALPSSGSRDMEILKEESAISVGSAAFILLQIINVGPGKVNIPNASVLGWTSAAKYLLYTKGYYKTNEASISASRDTLKILEDSLNESKKSVSLSRDKLTELVNQYTELVNKIQNEMKEKIVKHEKEMAVLQAELKDSREKITKENQQFTEETRAIFNDHMKIKAPVQYWEEKQKTHEKEASRNKDAWVGSSKLLAAFTLSSYALAVWIGGDNFYKVVPGVLALAVLGIWYLRISARLWLSNLHLAEDAKERVAMAKSYLAFMSDGASSKMSNDEKVVVLSTLFRPSKIGVITEDSMPTSPTGFISRAVSGGSGG
jgi:hypothetical protein